MGDGESVENAPTPPHPSYQAEHFSGGGLPLSVSQLVVPGATGYLMPFVASLLSYFSLFPNMYFLRPPPQSTPQPYSLSLESPLRGIKHKTLFLSSEILE